MEQRAGVWGWGGGVGWEGGCVRLPACLLGAAGGRGQRSLHRCMPSCCPAASPPPLPPSLTPLQSAVEYAQSWCTLVAAGRLHFVPAKYARLLAAAQSHAHLTARQLDALLATQRTLPAHTTPPINAWLADWQAEASGRHASQQQQQRRRVAAAGPGAAVPAGASASSFAGYAVL